MRLRRLAAVVGLGLLAGCANAPRDARSEPRSGTSPAEIQASLAQAYLGQGQLDIAMSRANRALELNPRLPSAHTVAAIVYQRMGDTERAGTHYRRALALDPRSGDTLNNYGTFLCSQNDFADADPLFERALKDPFYRTPAVALANRGSCQFKAGNVAAAEANLRLALDLDPQNAEALFALASLNVSTGQTLSARAFIQRYLSGARASPDALRLAIDIESTLGNTRAVRDYETRLEREFPDSAATRRQSDGSSP